MRKVLLSNLSKWETESGSKILSKKWSSKGYVSEIKSERSYIVKTDEGGEYTRNRKFLRPLVEDEDGDAKPEVEVPGAPDPLRRSARQQGEIGPENEYAIRRF